MPTRKIEDTLTRLRNAASRAVEVTAAWNGEEPVFDGQATDDELREFASRTAEALPSDYVDYLKRCRRIVAMDVHNGYELFAPSSDVRSPERSQVSGDGRVAEEVPVLPVGGDGGGKRFLLAIGSRPAGRVWEWLHEYPIPPNGIAVEGLERVAASFSAFLARVADDWEHFVDGDDEWKFLSG